MIVENKIPTKMIVTDYPFKYPTAKEFAKSIVTKFGGQMIPTLHWANGIVFLFCEAAHEIDALWELRLNGTCIVHNITWAEMKEYEKIIKIEGFNIDVPVLDVSSDKYLSSIADGFVNLYNELENQVKQ